MSERGIKREEGAKGAKTGIEQLWRESGRQRERERERRERRETVKGRDKER